MQPHTDAVVALDLNTTQSGLVWYGLVCWLWKERVGTCWNVLEPHLHLYFNQYHYQLYLYYMLQPCMINY